MTEAFEFLDRLARHYQPGMWIGALRRAFGPMADVPDLEDTATIETRPPHYLIAMWAPLGADQPFLQRWPRKVALVAPDPRAAIKEMLDVLPITDRLWITEQPIDWVLMADIVMLCEPGLAPYQFQGLREFVDAEHQATLAAISVHYGGPDDTYEKFTRTRPEPMR